MKKSTFTSSRKAFMLSLVLLCGTIDASLMLTSGIFANIVISEAFQVQLKKARAEYLKIKNGSSTTNIQNSTTMEPALKKDAAVYNLQGQPVNKASSHGGIYVQNGRKYVTN